MYKVVKIMRVSGRRSVLNRHVSLDTAKSIVKSYPDSNRSMVVFYAE